MTGNIKENQKGISIVEIIAAMAIFIIALTLALSILIVFLNNPQLLSSKRSMERDMQNIADQIIFDFRNYTLDYDYYPSSTIPAWNVNNEIALRDNDGRLIVYSYTDPYIFYSIDGDPPIELNGDDIDFTNVRFTINPSTSPWAEGSTSNFQPSLTLLLEGQTIGPEPQSTWLQTSVMSRNYFR